jgi:hypothetical protein
MLVKSVHLQLRILFPQNWKHLKSEVVVVVIYPHTFMPNLRKMNFGVDFLVGQFSAHIQVVEKLNTKNLTSRSKIGLGVKTEFFVRQPDQEFKGLVIQNMSLVSRRVVQQ